MASLVAELALKCIAQFHTAQMSLKFFVKLLRSLKLHGRNMRVHLQHSTINLDNLMAQQDKVMSMCWVTSFNGRHSSAHAHTDTGKHRQTQTQAKTNTYVAHTKIISDLLQRYIDSMQSASMWQTQYSRCQSNYGNRRCFTR